VQLFRLQAQQVPSQLGLETVTLGNSGTVDYRGSGNQTVSSQGYGNLTITQNGSRTVTFSNSSTIGIAGVFYPDAVSTTYVVTGNTVNFNGTTGNQNIPAFAFNNLHIENASGVTPTGNVSEWYNCRFEFYQW
jgi:hypothetical protein